MLDSRSHLGRIADRTGSDLGVRSRRATSGPASIDQESLQSKHNSQERLNTNNSNRLITKRLRVVFFGDRQDPFARSIADAIPRLDRAWDCPDLIPDLGRFGRELGGYHVIVAHRANPRPIVPFEHDFRRVAFLPKRSRSEGSNGEKTIKFERSGAVHP